MGVAQGGRGDQGFVFPALAAAVVDREGRISGWSEAAARLLGFSPQAVCGRPFAGLLADADPSVGPSAGPGQPPPAAPAAPTSPAWPGTLEGRRLLRTADRGAGAGTVAVDLRALPLLPAAEPPGGERGTDRGDEPPSGTDEAFAAAAGSSLLLFAPVRRTDEWGYGVSLMHALLRQREFGVVVHGPDLRVAFSNMYPDMFGGHSPSPGEGLADVAYDHEARDVEEVLRKVLDSGQTTRIDEQRLTSPSRPGREWTLTWSALQLADARGRPAGVAAVIEDVTQEAQTRRHRDLMQHAASAIGLSLDLRRTAQELADVVVGGGLSDLAAVDLALPVLDGEEPAAALGSGPALVRVATAAVGGGWPDGLLGAGDSYPPLPEGPRMSTLQGGRVLRLPREDVVGALGSERLVRLMVPAGAHSLIVAPLTARGLMLGTVTAWRTARSPAFDGADTQLLAEIASRAALGIDNGRRYTREHAAAVALQQRLLPRADVDTPAAEVSGTYLPAGGGTGVSGDWFDTLPLPSLRTALVVGDVIGHGLSAAATMGRLRTAVQTYADLELDPGEVLSQLEALVHRLVAEAPADQRDAVGASCLFALYDATTGECAVASAGHPPPVVCAPDGTVHVPDVRPGPPLGVGGVPFQTVTFPVEPGSVIALYTDGLFQLDRYDGPDGPAALGAELAARRSSGGPLREVGRTLVDRPRSRPPRDDIALLLARTKAVDPGRIAAWSLPPRLDSVAEARAKAVRQLSEWGYEELAFTTELVVSELVTNAVRHGSGRVGLRLILDQVLVCEVSDASNTQPRLRRAAETDEGGRGLFIVAQCTTRWGCRYGAQGKTIWTEQPLSGPSL
ncbi:SpoIIE family protein phosphatase [Actinacidiphila yeochonensis]|uniref:SpoIIE family protein phosphatase n=1 Tax=Actinacidiphila yeochonensis TaxID=89050 RepID=UPI0006919F81|nr:SpoIIE family protein phosphatase [Actinacidiphila yeochonensis]